MELHSTRFFEGDDHGDDAWQPLFLYYAPPLVHTPFQAPDEYIARCGGFDGYDDDDADAAVRKDTRAYCAMIVMFDESLANVSCAVDRLGWQDDTLLVVMTDNGGANNKISGSNFPLSGGKGNIWNGGMLGNAFISSPRLVPRGSGESHYVFAALAHMVDWLPTLMHVATDGAWDGTPLSGNALDGFDLWDAILGAVDASSALLPSPRTELAMMSDDSATLLYSDDDGVTLWKLNLDDDDPNYDSVLYPTYEVGSHEYTCSGVGVDDDHGAGDDVDDDDDGDGDDGDYGGGYGSKHYGSGDYDDDYVYGADNHGGDYGASYDSGCVDSSGTATDLYGHDCALYALQPLWCGRYDDSDFRSNEMCCGCRGGGGGYSSGDYGGDNHYGSGVYGEYGDSYGEDDTSVPSMSVAPTLFPSYSPTTSLPTLSPSLGPVTTSTAMPSMSAAPAPFPSYSPTHEPSAMHKPTPRPTSCEDTADGDVADAGGRGCAAYLRHPNRCGRQDDDDFSASDVCCVCGGGARGTTAPSMSAAPTPFPSYVATPAAVCEDTCFGQSCDFWDDFGYSCAVLESTYNCGCGGCDCDGADDNDDNGDDIRQ